MSATTCHQLQTGCLLIATRVQLMSRNVCLQPQASGDNYFASPGQHIYTSCMNRLEFLDVILKVLILDVFFQLNRQIFNNMSMSYNGNLVFRYQRIRLGLNIILLKYLHKKQTQLFSCIRLHFKTTQKGGGKDIALAVKCFYKKVVDSSCVSSFLNIHITLFVSCFFFL